MIVLFYKILNHLIHLFQNRGLVLFQYVDESLNLGIYFPGVDGPEMVDQIDPLDFVPALDLQAHLNVLYNKGLIQINAAV